jgi:hypothetical protein
MTTKMQRAEAAEAAEQLRGMLKPGDTVWTVLRHVSRSGMRRRIDLLKIEAGETFYLTGQASRALNPERKQEYPGEGITTDGAGMDMGFELVYRLGQTLWPDGFTCAGEPCQSNDHVNGTRTRCQTCGGTGLAGDPRNVDPCPDCHGYGQIRGPSPERDGKMHHRSGGYALSHRWL